jgi:hypothetical protein
MGWAARLNRTPRDGQKLRFTSEKAHRDAQRLAVPAGLWIRAAFGLPVDVAAAAQGELRRAVAITTVDDDEVAA